MTKLAPSLLSADFYNLEKDLKILEEKKIEILHLDVMDGHYVPNISYGPVVIRSLRPYTSMFFDVHLMIDQPERYIEEFAGAGADLITIHVESTKHPHRVIQQIHATGCKAGVSLNPSTDLSTLEFLLEDLDLVLLMSVNPGFGGQKYIQSNLRKIKALRQMITSRQLDEKIAVEVDGGVHLGNVVDICNMGVDIIVAGSNVFHQDGLCEQLDRYAERLGEVQYESHYRW